MSHSLLFDCFSSGCFPSPFVFSSVRALVLIQTLTTLQNFWYLQTIQLELTVLSRFVSKDLYIASSWTDLYQLDLQSAVGPIATIVEGCPVILQFLKHYFLSATFDLPFDRMLRLDSGFQFGAHLSYFRKL